MAEPHDGTSDLALAGASAPVPVSYPLVSRGLAQAKRLQAAPEVRTQVNGLDGSELVWIPEGEFLMGSDPEDLERLWECVGPQFFEDALCQVPKHHVGVSGFWLGKFPVTVGQFREFVRATGYRTEAEHSGRSMVCGQDRQEFRALLVAGANWLHPRGPRSEAPADHPVSHVSWYDALAYCRWAKLRLPKETEWEYGVRGGNTGLNGNPHYLFPWGDQPPTEAVGNWWDEAAAGRWLERDRAPRFPGYVDGYAHTSPVGAFPPNQFGLYDMVGNVTEWCRNWRKPYPGSTHQDEFEGYYGRGYRVLRGGSWFDFGASITCAGRGSGYEYDTSCSDTHGFRCAKSA